MRYFIVGDRAAIAAYTEDDGVMTRMLHGDCDKTSRREQYNTVDELATWLISITWQETTRCRYRKQVKLLGHVP